MQRYERQIPSGVTGKELLIWEIRSSIKTNLVESAFNSVDRGDFAPPEIDGVYKDKVIHLGDFSSISEPGVVATMTELLGLTGKEKVLEVGTASGFQAAILSKCAKEVHTIEQNSELAESSSERLKKLGFKNVFVRTGDGFKGIPEEAPFDAIILTAQAREMPPLLCEQLAEGGRIVSPIAKDPLTSQLVVGVKYQGVILSKEVEPIWFVPLFSKEKGGWTEELLKTSIAVKKAFLRSKFETIKREDPDGYPETIAGLKKRMGYSEDEEVSVEKIIEIMIRAHQAPDYIFDFGE